MPHDEETEVRQRLHRLTVPPVGVLPPPAETPFAGVPLVGALPPRAGPLIEPDAGVPPGPDGLAAGPGSRLPGPGAFDPGRRGVRALAVVAAVVVLGAAGWAWRSRPQQEPVAPLASEAAPATSAGDPSASGTGELVVAVAGKVRRPGLVRLPAGSRLADAVQAAGGALPGVDVALLNPARKLTDGELIVVGVTPPPVPGGAAGPAVGGAAPAAEPLNLNTATLGSSTRCLGSGRSSPSGSSRTGISTAGSSPSATCARSTGSATPATSSSRIW